MFRCKYNACSQACLANLTEWDGCLALFGVTENCKQTADS
jgi:hypothetical protein